jgi:hypothetical protein
MILHNRLQKTFSPLKLFYQINPDMTKTHIDPFLDKWVRVATFTKKVKARELKGMETYESILKTLFEEIVTKPFDNHVALAWSHGFIIDTNDQGH